MEIADVAKLVMPASYDHGTHSLVSIRIANTYAEDIVGSGICQPERVCKLACAAASRQRRIRLCITERVLCFCTR